MKSVFIGAASLVFLAGCQPASVSDTVQANRAPVDSAIDAAVANGAFPFLYVRVEDLNGVVVYEHSATNPEFAAFTPTEDTWMRLWSMSKSVTIATILSMEEDGLLSRTDPVTDYIPEFSDLMVLSKDKANASCDEGLTLPARAITIEDLLNHNDGFYYPFTGFACLDSAMAAARLPEASSSDELITRISALSLHPTGVGEHQYGIGTTILGLVAERATGEPFDALVEAHITAPLGIADTLTYRLPANEPTYPRVTGKTGQLALAAENDLDIFGGPVPQYESGTNVFFGGEGMVGTTRAYATFLRMMGNHGELDGTLILEPETVRDWYAPKTQLNNPYGKNGFNIWVTSGKFDNLPDQKPGLLVGGGYEGTAFWIDIDAGLVGLIMSQVHSPATQGVDEVSKIRGLLYEHVLEPGENY